MNYMILGPNGNMAIVVNTEVYDIAIALEKFPDITNDLVAAGKFAESGVLVGNHYYTGDPEFQFTLNMHNDYPESYLVQDVEACAKEFGAILDKRQFNWCYLLCYAREDAIAFMEWCKTNRPGWAVSIPEESAPAQEPVAEEPVVVEEDMTKEVYVDDAPKSETDEQNVDKFSQAMWETQHTFDVQIAEERPVPEDAVLDEEAIQQAVITPEIDDSGMSLSEAEQFVYESERPPVVVEVRPMQEIPEECRGETWAQTWKRCRPSDVTGDVFCIEKNWEKRGDYYIIDCVMTGMRLIHSDKLGVSLEVSAKLCR